MKPFSIDVVKFVNEVKKHRQIWDMRDINFRAKRKVSKVDVWKEVAEVLIPDYTNMTTTTKFDLARKLYNKWRNMKDCHIRMLRRLKTSRMSSNTKPDSKKIFTPYIHAKHLSFLNRQYNYSPIQSNDEKSDEEQTNDDTFTIDMSKKVTVSNSTHNNSGTSENSGTSDDDTQINRRKTNKPTIEFVDTPVPRFEVNYSDAMLDDEDRLFFDSMLPAVRELTLDQKLEFRCEVLKLINSIRSDATNSYKSEFDCEIFAGEDVKII